MEWQPIENKPRDGEWALVYMGNGPFRGIDTYRSGFFVSDEFLSAAHAYGFSYDWITHWMPLPSPPKEEK